MTIKLMFGYMSSTPFWYGTYLPQRIQGIIIRDYCLSNDIVLKWSIPEISKENRTFTYHRLVNYAGENNIDGIVIISYLMHSFSIIEEIIEEAHANGLSIHFAIENVSISKNEDPGSFWSTAQAAHLAKGWENVA